MPSVTWLGSQPGHVQYGDLLLGPGTGWSMVADPPIQGWEETVPIDSGTVLRPQQHGAWPGRQLGQTRTVTLNLIGRCEPGQASAVTRALAARTPPDATDEVPLIVQLDDMPLLSWGRVVRRYVPPSTASRNGLIKGASLQIVCTDPRRYQLAEQTASTALPAGEAGLAWGSPTETGLDWGSPTETGLAWGTPGSTGDITAVNAGDAPVHPVIEFRGPVTTPSITAGGLRLEYDITLAAGDVLVVDTWAGTVDLAGQSRLGTATLRSVPEGAFLLPSGSTTTLSFRASPGSTDPAASATVRWRSAYW
ncbi:hypothetical protein [Kitasatospora sp. NPDC057738]|uniref:hypothetical protein n=1 Tax=Kitasatospora sp. NPDC057738 TaxID=3346233 RepID=UPI00368D1429